jgi:hypothetical protein
MRYNSALTNMNIPSKFKIDTKDLSHFNLRSYLNLTKPSQQSDRWEVRCWSHVHRFPDACLRLIWADDFSQNASP